MPIQLAVYAGGEPYWVDDEHVHHRQTWVEKYGADVDFTYGLTAHLPAMEGRCQLYWEDLVDGRVAAEHAIWVRDWHKRKRRNTPIDTDALARARALDAIANLAMPTVAELRTELQKIHKEFRVVWTTELTEAGKKRLAEALGG